MPSSTYRSGAPERGLGPKIERRAALVHVAEQRAGASGVSLGGIVTARALPA